MGRKKKLSLGVSITCMSVPGWVLLKAHTLETTSLGSAGWALLNLSARRAQFRRLGAAGAGCHSITSRRMWAPDSKTKAWTVLSSRGSRAEWPLEVQAGQQSGTPRTPMRMVPPGIPSGPSPRRGLNLPAAACLALQDTAHRPQVPRTESGPGRASHSGTGGSRVLRALPAHGPRPPPSPAFPDHPASQPPPPPWPAYSPHSPHWAAQVQPRPLKPPSALDSC